jgi:hypothetical protein
MRLRRASDNTEQDIGFNGIDLDTTSLTAFCTGTDCFIHTWYDQSGNADDLVQTTNALQYKIYDSATGIVLDNGKPAGHSVADYFSTGPSIDTTNCTFIIVGKHLSGNIGWFFGSTQNSNSFTGFGIQTQSTGAFRTYFGDGTNWNVQVAGTGFSLAQYLLIQTKNTSGWITSLNESEEFQYVASVDRSTTGTFYLRGQDDYFQEVIIYDSDRYVDNDLIKTNINNYYKIWIPWIFDLQEFDTSGTWTKPANCLMAEVVIVGAGGGGASGSKRSSGSTSQGGSAGAGGAVFYNTFLASSLGATESVTIGVGGSGGAAVTANDINGTTGGTGGISYFGSHVGLPGGNPATYNVGGVQIGPWSAGVNPSATAGFVPSERGRTSSVAGTGNGTAGSSQSWSGNLAASPSGGSIAAASTGIGGAGNRLWNQNATLNTAATAAAIDTGTKSGDGLDNYSEIMSVGPIMWNTGNIGTMFYGTSGAGGSASVNPISGGDAGDSGKYGQGGAGGGACQNGGSHVSGKGGNGGGACIKVLSVCYPS